MNKSKQTIGVVLALCCLSATATANSGNSVLDNTSIEQTSKTIKGTVLDLKGEPVVGANVHVKGTTNGTITDLDGNFLLNVEKGNTLEVTFVGYKTYTVKVGSQSSYRIVLKEDTQALDELVVVGYGTQRKADLTGAVSSVKVDEILGDRPITNLSTALKGSVPGLQIRSTSAKPGATPNLNIRGTTSLNGGSPLILVDNMPMDINLVNPSDIESVNVLKDASASAIYGAKAAFGVILITTKQGKKNEKLQLNYSGNFSFSKPTNLPHSASPAQLIQGKLDSGQVAEGGDLQTWLELIEDYNHNPSKYSEDGTYLDENGSFFYLKEHDRVKDMLSNFGFQQSHNLSFSGSTKKSVYRVSLGMVNEDGILVTDNDSYKRYNLSSFISSDITSWLKIQADIKYVDADTKDVPNEGIRYGIWGNAMINPCYYPLGGREIDGQYYPLETPRHAIENQIPTDNKRQNIRALGRAIITLMDGLTLTGEYAYIRTNNKRQTYTKKFDIVFPGEGTVKPNIMNSSYRLDKSSNETHAINIFANYNKTFGKHNVNLMAGFNQEDYDSESSWMRRLDMINGELPSIGQATGELTAGDGFSQHSTRSLFYRVNYSYDGKYLVGTNGRYDGSSKFPKDSRFGFFPSLSLGWRISSEPFMKWSEKYLSNLKARFTFGEIGNQAINPYAFVPTMDAYNSSWLVNNGLVTTLRSPGLVSNSFTWETVQTFNYGIDLGLFNNKFNVNFDYYIRNTKNMLAPGMELPSVLGAAAPRENVADLQTKGWELAATWNDRIGDFNYRVGFNLYDSKSKITKFDNEVGLLGNHRVGQVMGEIWGYETERLYQESDFDAEGKLNEGLARVEGVIPRPGDVLYVDQNGDGIINKGHNTVNDCGDYKIIGNSAIRMQYGINASASYKGIGLSLFFQGVGKRDVWANNDLVFPFRSDFSTIFDHQLDYWTPENTDAFYPRLYERASGNTGVNRHAQTRFLQNGAYCRLKNITLSYDLPVAWFQRLHVDKVNVFFSGEDLWTHSNMMKGLDPETNMSSYGWEYPVMKKLSFGINVTL